MDDQSLRTPSVRHWIVAVLVAAVGVTWQFSSLDLVERSVTTFPRVTDIVMDRLPRLDFGVIGELWFFGCVLLFSIPHFRRSWRTTPEVLTALGLMYFIRGWFLYLFPIGAPLGAVGADERLSIWGHESHAYFPGGHIAILTVLALSAPSRPVRIALWIGLILFGLGTMLSKTHYTMDSVGGILLGYAATKLVQSWTMRRTRVEVQPQVEI